MTPAIAERLQKMGIAVAVERGAGEGSGMADAEYSQCGAVLDDVHRLYGEADIVLRVQLPEPDHIRLMRPGALLVSFVYATRNPREVLLLKERRITAFAMELVPRISRAQGLDALSSQAMAAGYRAVLVAAHTLERFFPMLITAAGAIRPAKVLVIGAGVAGLQAIATAKRLGAQVEGYDVRPASREEVESLGARFVSAGIQAASEGGYARELTPEEQRAQQQMLADHIRQADAVICTASVPGRPAPKIVLKSMVDGMKAGSVIVDLAAESGGNCELTEAGREVKHGGTTILGPLNLAATLAEDASRLYAQNIYNLLSLIVQDGEIRLDWEDDVIRNTVLTYEGQIKNEATRRLLEGDRKE
jgi:H+-translocating NAD(P) transhydrogenase subunit alpha